MDAVLKASHENICASEFIEGEEIHHDCEMEQPGLFLILFILLKGLLHVYISHYCVSYIAHL